MACSPAPPPNWEGWVQSGTTDIFAGRVTARSQLPDTTVEGLPLRPAMLQITRLASYDGRPGPTTVDVWVVDEILDPALSDHASARCLHPEPYEVGEVLLIMQGLDLEPRLFSREWVGQSRFTPLFDGHQDAPR